MVKPLLPIQYFDVHNILFWTMRTIKSFRKNLKVMIDIQFKPTTIGPPLLPSQVFLRKKCNFENFNLCSTVRQLFAFQRWKFWETRPLTHFRVNSWNSKVGFKTGTKLLSIFINQSWALLELWNAGMDLIDMRQYYYFADNYYRALFKRGFYLRRYCFHQLS